MVSRGAGAAGLTGALGDDTLVGGPGIDRLAGGPGNDTADYSNAAGGVTVKLWAGMAFDDGDGGVDILIGIDNLIGSSYNDVLTGDGWDNVLDGGAGDDVLTGSLGRIQARGNGLAQRLGAR